MMADRKRSVVWKFFISQNSYDAVCNVCGKALRHCGNTTNLVKHLKSNHTEEYDEVMQRRSEEEERKSAARAMQTSLPESFGGCPVEVVLDDRVSDIRTTLNESEISSAINGILEAAHGAPVEQSPHEEASDDVRPVRRGRNKRSTIWRHFERLDSLNAVRCRICMKKLQCVNGGSTSNLHRHMSKRHPEVFSSLGANRLDPPASVFSQDSNANGNTLSPEQRPFSGSRASEGEKRVLRRERELVGALRRAQKEEAQALQHQRELLEKLRAADAREAAAEREKIESLRRTQQEEAKELDKRREELQRDKEELQREREELQKKWEELKQEREELILFPRGQ